MERKEKLIPISDMRQIIAHRMKHSLDTNAQLSHQVYVDMTKAGELRKKWKEESVKISYNDIILAASTKALTEFPMMNSELKKDGILVKEYVNIGVAVALEEGLIVPNIKDAQLLDLQELSSAAADLSKRAREGRLQASEYKKGTFTVTNLGMMGIHSFNAIINEPEAGILAVGAIEDTPVAENGKVVVRPMMSIVLSYDHRLVDGAPAAQFITRVKELIENTDLL